MFAVFFNLYPAYVLLTCFLAMAGLSKGVLRSEPDANTLCFRRPHLYTLANVAFALLFLLTPLLIVEMEIHHYIKNDGTSNDWLSHYVVFPLCLGVAVLLLSDAGPEEVCIDLEARMCHAKQGWAYFPRRFDCPLNDTSTVYVWSGGYGSYVVLGINDGKERRFMLSIMGSMSAATSRANDLAQRLDLPVRVTTFAGMRDDLRQKRLKG